MSRPPIDRTEAPSRPPRAPWRSRARCARRSFAEALRSAPASAFPASDFFPVRARRAEASSPFEDCAALAAALR